MFHPHVLNSDEEGERTEDLDKEEVRGEDFKNRLETIKNLGIENGVQRKVMKKWAREMKDTFMKGKSELRVVPRRRMGESG